MELFIQEFLLIFFNVSTNIKIRFLKGLLTVINVRILVYSEMFYDREHAILREKQLKEGSRKQKLKLIESKNPLWHDLYESLF